ncbi:cation diffusion facilitator family transporter [Dysgonomonas sp. 520]|uniref:cation diffusion facilitator family transporter n=1 Tax=Dysgonomonas sp. 520 TaxID=2302931 RepID=UPI0013D781F8|nr:cation diffusion facilitator family transporter [Dysgonomonas sp. 520]NDW08888.1 cation transporter [Dysgonomonas sp. 520]
MSQNTSHSHSHGHSHGHSHTSNKRALMLSFILITGFMFVEFLGGLYTDSLALLSDAGHMLSDSVALGLSLTAVIFGARAATASKTYGYKRFEILAALLNGIILICLSFYICYEAIHRISKPVEVMGSGMMLISVTGLIINIVVAYILSRGQAKENLNVRSAFLHVIGDLLGSVGAITAAILIMAFGWYIADPIASIIVSLLVLYSGFNIIKESVNILMEGKPSNISISEVRKILLGVDGVLDIHDLHIWMITAEFPAMTAHMMVNPDIDRDKILEDALLALTKKTGIKHITLQLEGRKLKGHDEGCCI